MIITIKPGSVDTILAAQNIDDLLSEYAQECALPELGPCDPQWDTYRALENAGVLTILEAYADLDTLVGFMCLLIHVLPHYGVKMVISESLFVASQWRTTGAGMLLIHEAQDIAYNEGAKGLMVSAPQGSQLQKVLPLKGFKPTSQAFLWKVPCSPD